VEPGERRPGARSPDADPDSEAHGTYARDRTTPCSHAVVAAVSDFVDCSPLDLEPLYLRVDPEALDRLVDAPNHLGRRLLVEFDFGGCSVEVTRSGIDVGYATATAQE
jgi:hypothetical protein